MSASLASYRFWPKPSLISKFRKLHLSLDRAYDRPTSVKVSTSRPRPIVRRTCFYRKQNNHASLGLPFSRFLLPYASLPTDFVTVTMCKLSSTSSEDPAKDKPEKKLSLVQRYHKMLKEYWYVVIPVHLTTSLVWFGAFYYAAKCGIDIVPYLEQLGVSDKYLAPLRSSSLGYIAVAVAMYKIASPARYIVTLGGTTMTINYLSKRGLLPSKDNLKQMMRDKKDSVVNKFQSKH